MLVIALAGFGAPVRAADAVAVAASRSIARAALQAERAGYLDQAALLYRQAHAADPSDAAPLRALGTLADRIGDPEAAEALFRSVVAIDPRDRAARQGLGFALIELDRGDDALAVFEVLLAEDTADARAWNGKGLALDLLGRHPAAQQAFHAGLVRAPGDAALLAGLEQSKSVARALPGASSPAVELAFNADRQAESGLAAATGPSAVRD